MNIVLEALERLYEWATHGVDSYGLYLMKDNKQIVLKALKRNEPMKAIYTRFTHVKTEDFWHEPTCPKCKSLVIDEDKFCRECGQALDWEIK